MAEPAPELAAAMAETRAVRDGYARLCGEFGPSPQSGWSARVSLTTLNRHRESAGLEAFSRTESNSREDVTLRYRRERDEAREQLADAAAIAASWPRCPDGCGCRLGTEDPEAAECGCDGPCTIECRENGYPDAMSYRDLAVAAERERVRQMAIETRAVTVSQTGRMLPFEELLRQSPEENAAALLKVVNDSAPGLGAP
jgi:hypothetical protein